MPARKTMRFCAVLFILFCLKPAAAQNQQPILPSEFDEFATLLITTKTQEERNTLIATKTNLLTPDLRKALIRQGNASLMAGQYASAFNIYGIAQNVAQIIGDREGLATAFLDLGTVYYFQANYPEALDNYRKARLLFIEVRNDYEAAKALSGMALIYKEQRRDPEALAAFQQTLTEFTQLSDKEEMATTLSSMGTIYYGQGKYREAAEAFRKSTELDSNPDNVLKIADALYMQGDYAQALRYYKDSLASASTTRPNANSIVALNGAANSAYYLGNYDEALQFHQQNLTVEEWFKDRTGVANSLRGIGNVHRVRGDYGAALESYFKSLNIAQPSRTSTAGLVASIGLTRALQGNNTLALEAYNKALRQFETEGNQIDTARVLSLIGNAHYVQGEYDLAVDSYQKGLKLRESMRDKPGQIDLLVGLGTTFLKQQKFTEAHTNYQAALALAETVGNRQTVAEIFTRLGDVYLAQSNYEQALTFANKAFALAQNAKDSNVLWYSKLIMGKALRGLNQQREALQSFNAASAIIESLRSQPTITVAEENRNTILPYTAAVDILVQNDRREAALDAAERGKIQYLYEVFRRNNAKSTKGLLHAEQEAERKLIGSAVSLELQLERERQLPNSSETRRSSLANQLASARASYIEFRKQVFLKHPRLKVDRGEIGPINSSDLRALLNDRKTALLEYVITENNIYLFVARLDESKPRTKIPPVEISVHPLNIKTNDLWSLVKQTQAAIASRDENATRPLRQLYDALLRPAEDAFDKSRSIVIVPDGVLWHVPFEALQPADERYLVDQADISYAPSLSALRELRKRRGRLRRNRLVALGAPKLNAQFPERVRLAYPDVELSTTPDQQTEVEQIGNVYNGARSTILVGNAATEQSLIAGSRSADILHIAAPALLDDSSPMSSFVALAAPEGSNEDGLLKLRDVLKVQTPARVVVMSGAQRRADQFGAAKLALSWSWFVAGTPAVLLSRWDVKAPATIRLMTEFHSKFRPGSGLSRAQALQQSALTLRRSAEYRHPFYWSGFALIGDGR
jgi:CHAT domain-containing protein/cytochrome c-type biogenesis protein CcmH/NrfG